MPAQARPSAPFPGASGSGAHFDVQFQKLRFPVDPDSGPPPLSVTIALRSPHNGTGLQVYDITFADYERAYRLGRINNIDELVRRKTSAYYPYTEGNIVLHRGLVMHCLTSPGQCARAEWIRIALPYGHGSETCI